MRYKARKFVQASYDRNDDWGKEVLVRWLNMQSGRFTIIEKDKEDIDNSEIILVWIDKPSFGTAMEIMYASMNGQTVFVVNNIGDALSPWVAYHATLVFNTLQDACEAINRGAF
jgi:nucleoside 2-deoxyribosyltransferase